MTDSARSARLVSSERVLTPLDQARLAALSTHRAVRSRAGPSSETHGHKPTTLSPIALHV